MAAAKAELWRRGELRYLLAPCQQEVYDAYKASGERIFVEEIGRQFGKSYIVAVLFCEMAIKKPGAVMHYAAPTSKMVKGIFLPNLKTILEDCPADLRPTIKTGDGTVEWPNESIVHMAGCEDELKADRLRGPASDFFVLDEAGFITCLKYVVVSIAAPQLLTTGGRMLVPSTPAKTPGHHFTTMCISAEAKGAYQHRSIYDSTRNNHPEIIAEFIELCGGEETSEWQREYLAIRVIDEKRAIIPAFAKHKEHICQPVVPPAYYDPYVVMDVGWSPSLTFVGFGFYDYKSAKLCLQRELVLDKMGTDELANGSEEKKHPGIKTIVQELWGEHFERVKAERPYVDDIGEVYGWWSDVDLLLIHDLANDHQLYFSPTRKDNKEAALNRLNIICRKHRLQIDPEGCPQLIAHMEAGLWNAKRTDYVWLDGFGHFDGIDMLSYMWRNVNESHNPYPPESFGKGPDYYTRDQPNQAREALTELFG